MFRVLYIYTDTWPHSCDFWKFIFGMLVIGRLGFFHLLKRILDTLNPRSARYWEALVGLKAVFYRYNADDENKLLRALKDGSFARGKTHYSDENINTMKHSKKWKRKCDPYLRKIFHPTETAVHNLMGWVSKFRNACDAEGKSLFSRDTEKAANNQTEKVQHIQDPIGIEMYAELPPGPRTTHGLSKYLSRRPESTLEKFHEAVAHFANTGMEPKLADCLTLRGTAEHNVQCRHRVKIQEARRCGKTSDIPQYLEEVPLFWNHSMLSYLNKEAQRKGLRQIFESVRELGQNNGEVFLSKYFEAQQKRNVGHGQDKATGKCRCPTCATVSWPLVTGESHALQEAPTAITTTAPPAATLPVGQNLRAAPPPSKTSSVIDTPSMQLAPTHWNNPVFYPYPLLAAPPSDRCFQQPPYYCNSYFAYKSRKAANGGRGVMGRIPHSCRTIKK
jgi:hypothetical protein